MSIAEKLTQIAANVQAVYNAGKAAGESAGGGGGYDEGFEAGKKAEYDALWDAAQENGNRTEYSFAFSGNMWSQETFKPKYPIKPTRCTNMLAYWGYNMTSASLEDNPIDLRFLSIDLSDCTDCAGLFYANKMVKKVGTIDVSMNGEFSLKNLFSACPNLVSIDQLKVTGQTSFQNTFDSCAKLESITFSGIIANDIDLRWSTKLSRNSILEVYWAAQNGMPMYVSTPTITLSKTAVDKAFETSDGKNDGSESNEWETLMHEAFPIYSLV